MTSASVLLLAHPQSVGNTIDIVEPTGDQIDLQNSLVAEADGTQSLQIARRDGGRIARQFSRVVEHRPVGGVEPGLRVIPRQLGGELRIERNDA
jgi:hypothetical protein